MPTVRRQTVLTLCLLSATLLALAGCQAGTASREIAASTKPYSAADVSRGEYLVTILACNDCHTPFRMGPHGPEPDMSRMLSGHPQSLEMPPAPRLDGGPWLWVGAGTNTAFAGPWGTSYASNLTPDENTGLGIWTEDMFVRALRTGRHMGTSRQIQPPMPWPWYGKMTDDDLKAVYAFLRSIPAISNRVPDWEEPLEGTKQQ